MRSLMCCAVVLVVSGCAGSGSQVSSRQLLSQAVKSFLSETRPNATPTVWLTNHDDSDCDRVDGAERKVRHNQEDALAYEVFMNHLVASQWGRVIESHRHNYARDFKPETRKLAIVATKPEVAMPMEDLCFLDEAKKRNADKVLVYELLALSSRGAMVHFRLSDARSGLVEVSKTLQVSADEVVDRSAR